MILYFHGFGSAGGGPKYDMLKERFEGRTPVYSPDIPTDPSEVPEMVRRFVLHHIASERDGPVVFVGSSLGGFYAAYFAAKWDVNCVLVNPSFEPSVGLTRAIGTVNDFRGGTFEWTMDHCRSLAAMTYDIMAGPSNGALTHLFVTKDDDVCPMARTFQLCPYRAWTQVFEDGGHRQIDHFPEVVDYIDTTFFGPLGRQYLVEPGLTQE